jgi:UDP-N-acetylglucosamine:LPS N-acetylglucosamine transferase
MIERPDTIALESLPMSFSDLLASADVLLCKPGYGSFVEAACSGTPVLYVNRPDWPESPALIAWLQQEGVCREVTREQLAQGDIEQELRALCAAPRGTSIAPNGAAQAAKWLAKRLEGSG